MAAAVMRVVGLAILRSAVIAERPAHLQWLCACLAAALGALDT